MPNKNVCIQRFEAHLGPINVLLFHWKHADILLSNNQLFKKKNLAYIWYVISYDNGALINIFYYFKC